MILADAIALCFIVWLVGLIINSVLIMTLTKKIDKYWSIDPDSDSEFMYFQFSRFHRYGYYLMAKGWSLKPVPKSIKLWVCISSIANVVTILFFAILWVAFKTTGRL